MGVLEITLFVDVVSPFAYEGFHILRNDPVFRDVKKTYVPIFLGGLMKMDALSHHQTGNIAPIQVKNKAAWINKERVRWARAFNIPITASPPPRFPPNTVHLMRAICCVEGQDKLCAVLERLYRDMWVDHVEVDKPDVFSAIVKEVLGEQEAERVLAEAPTKGKTILSTNTDEAFSAGAFGLLWLLCTNASGKTEGFWGVDHFGHVSLFLDLPRPGGGNKGWRSML